MNTDFFDLITKPTLVLNETRARANIHSMAEKARQSNVLFRPHFKTHQSAEIGTWFRDEGVRQITVSSVAMAEYFANAGWDDITIAFPINIRQLPQIRELASRINLGVLVESVEVVPLLGALHPSKINIWIKIDCGLHRTGISWEEPEGLNAILIETQKYPNLSIQGLLTHAGNTYTSRSKDEAVNIHKETSHRMGLLREASNFTGLKVSVGDTPGCSLVTSFSDVDEIRPGNFVFYDAEQLEIGSGTASQIAVALACPVVAVHANRDEVVLYGGAIHLSKESFLHDGIPAYGLMALPEASGWSEILPGCYVSRVSQEHGILSVPNAMLNSFHLGDLVLIIPTHSCLTAHLMRRYLTLTGKAIEMMPV
jgi:D-serine deaminase-like pyridoxal phosphate-dependent protein